MRQRSDRGIATDPAGSGASERALAPFGKAHAVVVSAAADCRSSRLNDLRRLQLRQSDSFTDWPAGGDGASSFPPCRLTRTSLFRCSRNETDSAPLART